MVIDVKCPHCNKKFDDIINYETDDTPEEDKFFSFIRGFGDTHKQEAFEEITKMMLEDVLATKKHKRLVTAKIAGVNIQMYWGGDYIAH